MRNRARQTRQTIANLKGEIAFREKLSRQHVAGETLLPDYYGKEEHDRILLERVDATLNKMKQLQAVGVHLSPFLELGAERGQRSLVLANDFDAAGFAIDISYHQLRTMEHFARLFGREKLPIRICCDANHLPFRSHSFPFAFCFAFLHHFPRLKPVVNEMHRVLSAGHLYFDEEPFKRAFKITLYRQKHKMYSEESKAKGRLIRLIEHFFSESWCDEVEHGIIENNGISIGEWVDALSVFESQDVSLSSINNISSKLGRRVTMRNIPSLLLGGAIAGLCRKAGRVDHPRRQADIYDLLGCPNCTITLDDGSADRPPLTRFEGYFRCSECGSDYPSRDGVTFLLPREELHQLYPDVMD